jgi:flagellum-specific ATP synthase
MMAIYKENEDLINIGAYQRGSNGSIDRAIQLRPAIEAFLAQEQHELVPWETTLSQLTQLALAINAPAAPNNGAIANNSNASGAMPPSRAA